MGKSYVKDALDVPRVGEQMTLVFEREPEQLAGSEHVHRWYDYVQGFDPDLASRKIQEHCAQPGSVVLDPFCGSGTTLVAAQMLGHEAIGVDANPVMCLVAKAKTLWDVSLDQFLERSQAVLAALEDAVVAGGPALDDGSRVPMKSVNKWFRPAVMREVRAAQTILSDLSGADASVATLLRLAYAKAMFESSQVSMCPGITFVKKPRPALRTTLRRKLGQIAADLELLHGLDLHRTPQARVEEGDARDLTDIVPSSSADVIFTSPPYPTDIEYTRQTRAELFFLGFIETMADVRAIKKRMVRGSPKNIYKADNNEQFVADYPKIQEVSGAIHELLKDKNWGWDYARMVREYFGDMLLSLREMHRVLKPGGWALLVVGDQTCKGVMIPVTEFLRDIGTDIGFADGYVEQVRERRSTTHSMSLPENLLALQKPA
jgi:DNA modification methylase